MRRSASAPVWVFLILACRSFQACEPVAPAATQVRPPERPDCGYSERREARPLRALSEAVFSGRPNRPALAVARRRVLLA